MKNSPEERRREAGFVVLAGWISFWLATACTILLAVIYIAVGDIPFVGRGYYDFPTRGVV